MEEPKTMTDILVRVVELIREDLELHDAVVSLLNSKAAHERALTRAADARRRKLEGETESV